MESNRSDGWFGFLRDFPGDSHNNGLINDLKDATMFFADRGGRIIQPRGEDGQDKNNIRVEGDQFHIYKIEITDATYSLSINGQEVHAGERNDAQYTNRIFYITPDGFDSHYGPVSYRVDWIRISGPSIGLQPSAIMPKSWGQVKKQ